MFAFPFSEGDRKLKGAQINLKGEQSAGWCGAGSGAGAAGPLGADAGRGSRRRAVLPSSLRTAPRPRAQAEVGRRGGGGRKERGSRDREARAAPLSGSACRRSRRGWPGYPGAADLVSGALGSGGPRCRPTVGAPSRAVAGWCWGDSPPPSLDRGARSGARRKDPSRAAPCERPGRHCLRPAPPPPRRTPQPERRGRPRLCPRPPRTPARSLRDRRRGRRHPPPRRRGARPADSFPTRASPSGETGAGTSGRKWALRSRDRPSGPLHRALSPGRSGERRRPFPPHIPKGQKDRLKDRRPAATP